MVGLMSSISAAPPGPNTLPEQACKRGDDIGALVGAHFGGGQNSRAGGAALTLPEPGAG